MFKNFIKWNMLLCSMFFIGLFAVSESYASGTHGNEEVYIGFPVGQSSAGGDMFPAKAANSATEFLVFRDELDSKSMVIRNLAMLVAFSDAVAPTNQNVQIYMKQVSYRAMSAAVDINLDQTAPDSYTLVYDGTITIEPSASATFTGTGDNEKVLASQTGNAAGWQIFSFNKNYFTYNPNNASDTTLSIVIVHNSSTMLSANYTYLGNIISSYGSPRGYADADPLYGEPGHTTDKYRYYQWSRTGTRTADTIPMADNSFVIGGTAIRPFVVFNKKDLNDTTWEYHAPLVSTESKYLYLARMIPYTANGGIVAARLTSTSTHVLLGDSNRSVYQYIYQKEILGTTPRIITHLAFQINSNGGSWNTVSSMGLETQPIQIYLRDTTAATFGNTNMVPMNNFTNYRDTEFQKVFDGRFKRRCDEKETITAAYTPDGIYWYEVELAEPYYYDGTQNLMMLIEKPRTLKDFANSCMKLSFTHFSTGLNGTYCGIRYNPTTIAGQTADQWANWTSSQSMVPALRIRYRENNTYCGPVSTTGDGVVPTNTSKVAPYAFGANDSYSRSEQIYVKTDGLNSDKLGVSKKLTSLSLWFDSPNSGSSFSNSIKGINKGKIYIKSIDGAATTVTNSFAGKTPAEITDYLNTNNYKQVVDNINVQFSSSDQGQWYSFAFDTLYSYAKDKNLDIILLSDDGRVSGFSAYNFCYYSNSSNPQSQYGSASSVSSVMATGTGTGISDLNSKPYMRFSSISSSIGDQQYAGSIAYQIADPVSFGAPNQAVIKFRMRVTDGTNLLNKLKSIRIDTKSSPVSRVTVIGTQTDSAYTTFLQKIKTNDVNSLFASTTTIPSNGIVELTHSTGFELVSRNNPNFSSATSNYFWIAVDVKAKSGFSAKDVAEKILENMLAVDASILSFELLQDGVLTSYSDVEYYDPAGERPVSVVLPGGVYRVGQDENQQLLEGCNYATLSECAYDFSKRGISGDADVLIMSNLIETKPILFELNPLGDDKKITIRPGEDVVATISADRLMNLFNIAGRGNLELSGIPMNSTVGNSLTLNAGVVDALTGAGSLPLFITASEKIIVKNITVVGDSISTAIKVVSAKDITLDTNSIVHSRYGIYLDDVSSSKLRENRIGDKNNDNSVITGLYFNNSHDITVDHNVFTNLYVRSDNPTEISNGVQLVGSEDIKLYYNTFNSITGGSSYGLNFTNTKNATLYHNTIYIYNDNLGKVQNASILYDNGGNSGNTFKNNIFFNTTAVVQPNIFSTVDGVSNIPSDFFLASDYNVYRSGFNFVNADKGEYFQTFGLDAHSTFFSLAPVSTSNKDNVNLSLMTTGSGYKLRYNINSEASSYPTFVVPMINGFDTDIDGNHSDGLYGLGKTYAGSDYPVLLGAPILDESFGDKNICEGDVNSLLLTENYLFAGWKDVQRDYIPTVHNEWYLTPVGAGAEKIQINASATSGGSNYEIVDPSLYVEAPVYSQSGEYEVRWNVGAYTGTHSAIVSINKVAEVHVQPLDVSACNVSQSVSLSIQTYGVEQYETQMWQKYDANDLDNPWKDVGAGSYESDAVNIYTNTLTLNYDNESELINDIIGTYRFKTNGLKNCLRSDVYEYIYSETCEILLGSPLSIGSTEAIVDNVLVPDDLPVICEGSKLVIVPTILGTALAYQWQKKDLGNNTDWVSVPEAVNQSAITEQLIIPETFLGDAGSYRCLVTGLDCGGGMDQYTEPFTVQVKRTYYVLEQPASQMVCSESTGVILESVVDGAIDGTYRWYKDGEILVTDLIQVPDTLISSRDTLISGKDTVVYDTTIALKTIERIDGLNSPKLVFNLVDYNDAGVYKLEYNYKACDEGSDVTYSATTDTANLYVYGQTEIIDQTENVRGFTGGYAILAVSAQTVDTRLNNSNGVPESYQWYRHVSGTDIALVDDYRIKGSHASTLVINPITEIDFTSSNNPDDYYYCVVTGTCNTAVSDEVHLKVSPRIVIDEEPINQSLCGGDVAEFAVAVSVSEPDEEVLYQWYKNGVAVEDIDDSISGAKTAKLTIRSASDQDEGYYKVDIRYASISAAIVSDSASLSVEMAPIIKSQSADSSKIDVGGSITLTVSVDEQYTDYVCDYTWYKNGLAIDNWNESYYEISDAIVSDSGDYSVQIKSVTGCGETTSANMYVDVETVSINNNEHSFRILSVTPNPVANNIAYIKYETAKTGTVKFTLIDISGAKVMDIHEGSSLPGIVDLQFDIHNLSNGRYYIRLEHNGQHISYPIAIAK